MITTQILSIVIIALFFVIPIHSMENKKLMPHDKFLQELAKAKKILQKKCTDETKARNTRYNGHLHVEYLQTEMNSYKQYNEMVAELALHTDMPNYEKLEYLIGDNYWQKRKEIITFIIDSEKINPNNIIYQNITPLEESAIHNDLIFTDYLLQKGATGIMEALKRTSSHKMTSLLQSYKQ